MILITGTSERVVFDVAAILTENAAALDDPKALDPMPRNYFEPLAAGNLAAVSDTVARFTGRPAKSLETYFSNRRTR